MRVSRSLLVVALLLAGTGVDRRLTVIGDDFATVAALRQIAR